MKPSLARRTLVAAALLGTVTVSCGAPDRGGVRSVGQVPWGLDTVPSSSTTTTSTTIPDQTTTSAVPVSTIATEDVRLYFISAGQLVGVDVPLVRGPSASQVIAALLNGPPEGSTGLGLRSALAPAANIRIGDDATGVAIVDLPVGFFDAIPTTDQRFAIGQIVLTLLDRPGFGQVSFTQQGQPIPVPLASNEPAAAGRSVNRSDYLALLQPAASRPTTTTSTTSTTTAVATTAEDPAATATPTSVEGTP